jgi:methylmalonyl-CoA mutase
MPDAEAQLAQDFEVPSRAAWMTLVQRVLKGADFEKRLVSRSADGIAVQPLYTRADAIHGTGARGRTGWYPGGWDVRQHQADPDPRTANAAILEDLQNGATSLLLQIAAPGQSGLSYAAGPLSEALDGVFLNACTVALDARDSTLEAAGSLLEIWRGAGVNENSRRGAFNYDPLGVLATTGTSYCPPGRSCEIAAKLAADTRTMSHVTALLADGRPYHEAGATEGQELAVTLATLVAYLRACEAIGFRPRAALGQIAVALAADADLFMTIAKLRAARRLATRVAEACGAGTAADKMPFAVTTSERMMARRDPWVNVLRTTIACAGAAFGGADAITVLPFTWALGTPGALARRLARNTHLVLQEESAAARVIDPAHGSWYVEKLTDDLASKAWAWFQDIEARGGMVRVLETGYIQGEVSRVADARANDVAHGRTELTGVSTFPLLDDDAVEFGQRPPAEPIMTGGFSVKPLAKRRLAEAFERLRDASDAHRAKTGERPKVFLACLGDLSAHSSRSTWIKSFLAAGGVETLSSEPLHNSADAGKAFAESGTAIACICSSDNVYAELGEATAGALKQAGASEVLMAGRPADQEAALKAAGVDSFVSAGVNAIEELGRLHKALGVQS